MVHAFDDGLLFVISIVVGKVYIFETVFLNAESKCRSSGIFFYYGCGIWDGDVPVDRFICQHFKVEVGIGNGYGLDVQICATQNRHQIEFEAKIPHISQRISFKRRMVDDGKIFHAEAKIGKIPEKTQAYIA